MAAIAKPVPVEILYFDGCSNYDATRKLVARVVADLGVAADVRMVNVPDPASATTQRFLGSPSIRVAGRDIEPGADERSDFALACRVYCTDSGLGGQPDEDWLREALAGGDARAR